jgi:formylglycine-generating enzyme required for sulfatase activity
MKLARLIALNVAASFSCAVVQAVNIPTVPVGNPGNPADMRYIDRDHPNGVGAVAYPFQIGKTEITNAQYVAFLNAIAATDTYGLYNPGIGVQRSGSSGSYSYTVKPAALGGAYTYDDKPVVQVTSGDAMRFANWLHNGQPLGSQNVSTTEDGAYTMNGARSNGDLTIVVRNAGARWWLPNEDEWYKAAYHKNDGVTGNYWDYPTGTNDVPNNNPPSSDTGNSANFYDDGYTTGDYSYSPTDSGAYKLSESPYGTFDQGGNVWEWDETLTVGSFRIVRGGSWNEDSFSSLGLHGSEWGIGDPAGYADRIGFRVASAEVPEPATAFLAANIFALLACRYRRRPTESPHPRQCTSTCNACIASSARHTAAISRSSFRNPRRTIRRLSRPR